MVHDLGFCTNVLKKPAEDSVEFFRAYDWHFPIRRHTKEEEERGSLGAQPAVHPDLCAILGPGDADIPRGSPAIREGGGVSCGPATIDPTT